MLKRTHSIYNQIGGMDERSKYLKRRRVVFRDKPIIKEYYKVNNEFNEMFSKYINLYRVIDYTRFGLLNKYYYNDKNEMLKYICYIMNNHNCEDRINLLKILTINPLDKESLKLFDDALEEIKIAFIFDNSI